MAAKQARVLIVEDDEDDFILTSDHINQLSGYDFLIDWVTNPADAMEQLKLGIHDICLLDYQLGAYTGLEVLQQATAQSFNVPIIMLTGQADDSLDEAALNEGATDFLVKGEITSARFTRAIRYAIARKELAQARQESLDAKIKNRTKDQFLAHLSHELRTPLTSIVGYTELLLADQQTLSCSKELNIILSNSKHLLSLLNDILDLSKIEANKLELVTEDVSLVDFFSDLIPSITLIANEKGLDLEFESQNNIPTHIRADKTRLRQVILNLVINAIKFTDQGFIKINVSCDNSSDGERFVIEIIDSGIGIPEEKLEFIFRPFEQIEEMISKSQLGAGLGLAISNELIRRMNGEISVSSKLHSGSTFKIFLPLDSTINERKQLVLNIIDITPPERFLPLQGKVLVVDDVDDIRQLITTFLQRLDLTVSTAGNGVEAIDYLSQHGSETDLVLMDIHMPEMDGREAVSHIRHRCPNLPILALTAGAMKGVEQKLLDCGFDGVISKPINQQKIYHGLCKFLSHDARSSEPKRSTPTAIVVEDDAEAAELIGLLLQTLNFDAQVVTSAQSCLNALDDGVHRDLFILDNNLGDGNGLDLAKQIRQHQSTGKIVMVSGYDMSQRQLTDSGIDHALLKPVTLEQLKEVV